MLANATPLLFRKNLLFIITSGCGWWLVVGGWWFADISDQPPTTNHQPPLLTAFEIPATPESVRRPSPHPPGRRPSPGVARSGSCQLSRASAAKPGRAITG